MSGKKAAMIGVGGVLLGLILAESSWISSAFSSPQYRAIKARVNLKMADGDSTDWLKELMDASGKDASTFGQEVESKMKGLRTEKKVNPKLAQNAALIKWLEEEGGVWMKDESGWGVAPHPLAISTDTRDELTNESSGRGLLAKREIVAGDQLFKIPLKLCLTKNAAREQLGEDALPSNINEFLAIACLLIREKYELGDKSFYKPYIDILPEVNEVNPTFTWNDEDLAFLDGSPLVAATGSLKRKIRREYTSLFGGENGLFNRFPDRFPKEAFAFDHWVWAFTMLFSRAVRLRSLKQGEGLAMVPYADLINHSPYSQAYLDAQETGVWLFGTGEEEVSLYADRGYRSMDQVYISYGPRSNSDLMLLYGFAVERNPFNSVDVTVAIAPRTKSFVKEIAESEATVDPLAEEKVAFLRAVGREESIDFPCYADRYPTELLQYLRLMQMTPEDTRGKPIADFDYTCPISDGNEAAVLRSIITAIKRQVGKYPTTEEDDANIIKDKGLFRTLSYNQRVAVRHRRNEKRLLKRTIAALEKDIRQQALDAEDLVRAEGNTLGRMRPGDKSYGKQKTDLEKYLDKMGLPIDIK